tara:strand:- start:45134 stop:45295 length:162 start_codon:yes stop_codon:yes gene_type:complete
MLLLLALPVLVLGWFFYQLGRREKWKEKQKRLTENRPDIVMSVPKKTDDKKKR